MRDHEQELIAALVEGRLDDESEARALISASSAVREEYEAQKLAYEALRGAGPAPLDASERSALHRDVWVSLRADTDGRPTKAAWYSRLAPVAAGLIVVVVVATVLFPGGQDAGDEETAPLAADSATSASTSIAAASEGAGGDVDDGETSGTTQESGEDAEQTPTDGAAAFYSSEAERVREGDFGEGNLETFNARTRDATEIEECVDAAGLSGFQVVATLDEPPPEDGATDTTTTTGPPEAAIAVAVPEDAELGTAAVAFVDLDTCEVVYTDE